MKKSIPKVMLEDHDKINNLFEEFLEQVEKGLEDHGTVMKKFFNFKWNLEKHFFVEEKVIFSVYSYSDEEESDAILGLVNEHKNMLWLVNRIEIDLEDKNIPKTMNLAEILKNHAQFENEILYPKLEEVLDKNEKQIILDRIRDVVS